MFDPKRILNLICNQKEQNKGSSHCFRKESALNYANLQFPTAASTNCSQEVTQAETFKAASINLRN